MKLVAKEVLFFFLFNIAFGSFSQKKTIPSDASVFQQVKERAREERKLIFIEFYVDSCEHCSAIENVIFKDSLIANFFNQHFVFIKLNSNKGEGVNLSEQYGIKNLFPTFVFTDDQSNMLRSYWGASARDVKSNILSVGQKALNSISPTLPLEMINKYQQGNKNPDFLLSYFWALNSIGMPVKEIADEYLKSQEQDTLYLMENWNIIEYYTPDINSLQFQYLLKNKAKIYSLYGQPVNEKIFAVYINESRNIAKDTFGNKEKRYIDLQEQIKKAKLPNESHLLAETTLEFYYTQKDWWNYSNIASSGIIEQYYFDNADALNNISWVFYEHVDDIIMLKKALSWAKCAIELDNNEYYNDTYANLLFKLGKVQEAIAIERKALKLAIKNNSDAIETIKRNLAKFERK